jgi:hypothetical protein
MCKKKCEHSMRMFLLTDYVVLYGVLFIFLWYLLISMYIHLVKYDWLDPDYLEEQFPSDLAGPRLLTSSSGKDDPVQAANDTDSPDDSSTLPGSLTTTPQPPTPGNELISTLTTLTTTLTRTFSSSYYSDDPSSTTSPQKCRLDAGQGRFSTVEDVKRALSIRPIPFARGAGIVAPWFVLITWCVCAHGTWRHAREIWTLSGVSRYHDLVIQIIALPVVYSLMALSAVLRMWRLMANDFGRPEDDWWQTWDTWHYKALQIYEADYAVADLYESWALHHFAVLAMAMLKQSFDSAKHVLERSAATVDTNSPMFQAWAGTLKGMHISVSNLAMLGIWSFVISCACSSCWVLATVLLEDASGPNSELGQMIRNGSENVKFFASGMGCVASSVAICNMIQIERTFHIELANFGPFLKFWGTKILVSIAFLQTIVFMIPVPPFKDLTIVQSNVTYSTLICYECLVIALLHMYAWKCDEAWYRYSDDQESPAKLSEEGAGLPTSVLGRRARVEENCGLSANRA